MLLEILRRCADAGQRVYVLKADIEKAFDSIDHEALFEALRRAGASRKTIALIKDIYAKAKAVIRFGRACGDIFNIGRGVLEGDIISALLFILALEVVFRQVGDDDSAPELGGIKISQIGFADDVIMLTMSSLPVFQDRVDRTDNCLRTKGLNFSTQKGKCVLTGMHGGPTQSVSKPTAEDIDKLKLKFACSYCGERRFVNLAGKLQHERTCDLGRDILHPGRFDVDCILDVRGPPEMRYYQVKWAPGQPGELITWEPSRNLGDFCRGVIQDWFTAHPEWHYLDTVEVEGEIRCPRCNRRDFASAEQLLRHQRREHKPPVITGTLAYKKAQLALHVEAHKSLPRIRIGGKNADNAWLTTWLGLLARGDGGQEEAVQRQLDIMLFKFRELSAVLTDRNMVLAWRLQHYVTGVLGTTLHNVGA